MSYEDAPNQDLEHLRLLGIFHYILGGLTLVCSCLPMLQFGFIGVALIGASRDPQTSGAPPMEAGIAVIVVGVVVIAALWVISAMVIYAGYCLQNRQRYYYCFVVAILLCLNVPLGTILGVFTLIVLSRVTVRDAFGLPATA